MRVPKVGPDGFEPSPPVPKTKFHGFGGSGASISDAHTYYRQVRNMKPPRFTSSVEKSTRKSTRWLPSSTRAPGPTGSCETPYYIGYGM